MNIAEIRTRLDEVARDYPPDLVGDQLSDVERIAFHVSIVTQRRGTDVRIGDLGGGIGLFSPGCAAIGMSAVLVDDFSDAVNDQWGEEALAVHRRRGVTVHNRDVVHGKLDLEPGTFDVITTFDSMEHWHASPKTLFHNVLGYLKPGGLFVLGVPNCVNLRKRLTVPLGIGKWSSMQDWYEPAVFRGHVREPDVDDLRYIARDMGLERTETFGRNWAAYASRPSVSRWIAPIIDRPLRLFPTLCSDIYLVGETPRTAD